MPTRNRAVFARPELEIVRFRATACPNPDAATASVTNATATATDVRSAQRRPWPATPPRAPDY
jgi:hypothetical protein